MANAFNITIRSVFDATGATAARNAVRDIAASGATAVRAAQQTATAQQTAAAQVAAAQSRAATAATQSTAAQSRAATAATQSAAATARAYQQSTQAAAQLAQTQTRTAAIAESAAQRSAAAQARAAQQSTQAAAQLAQTEQRTAAIAESAAQRRAAAAARAAQMEESAGRKAEASIIAHAQAQARLQAAEGNTAAAANTLRTALAQVTSGSVAATNAAAQLATIEGKAGSAFGGITGTAGKAVAAIGAFTIAMGGIQTIGSAISVASDTERSLNVFQATARATVDQMAQVSAKAKALGADLDLPATSAAGAGQAMTVLAQQGLAVNDVLGASKGVLQLAAAGMISEAEAATIGASALNEFHLQGSQMNKVSDLLAASISAAGSSVSQSGQAIQQAGAGFAAAGIPIEELVTSVDLMAKAGIRGSDAGTSLKTMLQRLQSPTGDARAEMERLGVSIYDASGQMLPYREIINQFSTGLATLSPQLRAQAINTIFGADAQRGANIVLAGSVQAYDAMYSAITKGGSANAMAQAQMKGLAGATAGFQSQIETLAGNALEPLLPLLAQAVGDAAAFAGSFANSIGPAVASTVPTLTAAYQAIKTGATDVYTVGSALVTVFTTIGGAITTVAGYVTSGATAFSAFYGSLAPTTQAIIGFSTGLTPLVAVLGPIGEAVGVMASGMTSATPALVGLTVATVAYSLTLMPTTAAILESVVALKTQAVAFASTALPIAAIALSVAGVVAAYQDYNAAAASVAEKVLGNQAAWQASADALKQYQDVLAGASGEEARHNASLTSAAGTVQALRTQIQSEVEALAKHTAEYQTFGRASGYTAASLEQGRQAIIQHQAALQQSTGALEQQIATTQSAAQSTNTYNALEANRARTLQQTAQAAQLSADAMEEQQKASTKAIADSAKDLGSYGQNYAAAYADAESRQAEHTAKMTDLTAKLHEAKNAKARAGVQEEIAAEKAGFSQQEQSAAESYAKQQSALRTHLGMMVADYLVAQEKIGKLTAAQRDAGLAATKAEYGSGATAEAEATVKLLSAVDKLGKGGSIAQFKSDLAGAIGLSGELALKVDKITTARTTTLRLAYEQGKLPLPEYLALVDKARTEVTTQVMMVAEADTQQATQQLAVTEQQARSLPTEIATHVMITTAGGPEAQGQLNATTSAANGVPTSTTTTAIANTSDAQQRLMELTGNVKAVPTATSMTISAETAKAMADIAAVRDRVDSLKDKSITISTKYVGGSAGGASPLDRNQAAGGGQFMTSGPTTLTVGDNPGGREMVTVVPLSGKGQTRVGHNMARMAGGGTLVAGGGSSGGSSGGGDANLGIIESQLGRINQQQQQWTASIQGTDAAQAGVAGTVDANSAAYVRAAVAVDTTANAAKKLTAAQVASMQSKAGDALAKQYESTASKLADLQQSTSKKLTDIDAKAAADQAKTRQELNNSMATSYADMIASMQADDLDRFSKSTDPKEFAAREAQQAKQLQMERSAQAEARQIAVSGDASLAKDTLAIREQAAQQRLALDERYNNAQAEVSKKQAPALKKEYDEAVAAQEAATQTRLDIARAESQQRAGQLAQDKATVVSEASAQGAQIVAEATTQAQGVRNATEGQKAVVVAALQTQAQAFQTWAASAATATQSVTVGAAATGAAIAGMTGNAAPSPEILAGLQQQQQLVASMSQSYAQTGAAAQTAAGQQQTYAASVSATGQSLAQSQTGAQQAVRGQADLSRALTTTEQAQSSLSSSLSESADTSVRATADISAGFSQSSDSARLMQNTLASGIGLEQVSSDATNAGQSITDSFRQAGDTVKAQQQQIVSAIQAGSSRAATVQTTSANDAQSEVSGAAAASTAAVSAAMAVQVSAVSAATSKQAGSFGSWASAVDSAVGKVVDSVRKAKEAINDLNNATPGSGGGAPAPAPAPNAAAGGGNFITSGPTTLTVGDNPGGAEFVSVVPISGKGQTRIGHNMAKMAGGGSGLAGMPNDFISGNPFASGIQSTGRGADAKGDQELLAEVFKTTDELIRLAVMYAAKAKSALKPLGVYAEAVAAAQKIFNGLTSIRLIASNPAPLIDPNVIKTMVADNNAIVKQLTTVMDFQGSALRKLKKYSDTAAAGATLLNNIIQMRNMVAQPQAPLDLAIVKQLARDARMMTRILDDEVISGALKNTKDLRRFGELTDHAIHVLEAVSKLRDTVATPQYPIDPATIISMAQDAQRVAALVVASLVPETAITSENLTAFEDAVGKSVATLTSVAELRKTLSDQGDVSPLNMVLVQGLATRARDIANIIIKSVVPMSEGQAEGLKRYAESAQASVSTLSAVAGLRKELSDQKDVAPFDQRLLEGLAYQSRNILSIVGKQMIPLAEAQVDAFKHWSDATSAGTKTLSDVAKLREDLSKPQLPIDLAYITALAAEARSVTDIVRKSLLPLTEAQASDLSRYADAAGKSSGIVKDAAGLREELATPQPAISGDYVSVLAGEAQGVTRIVSSFLIPTTEAQADGLSRYADSVSKSIGIVKDAQSLRGELTTPQPPISGDYVSVLAGEAQGVTRIVSGFLITTTEAQADGLGRYADSVSKSVSIVKDVAALRSDLSTPQPPINGDYVSALASEAQGVTRIVAGFLISTTEVQATDLGHYADSVAKSVSIVKDTAGLRSDLATPAPVLDTAYVTALATDAQQVTAIVRTVLLATTEQQATDISRYADATNKSGAIIKDLSDLRGTLSTPQPALSVAYVTALADDATTVAGIVRGRMLDTSQEQVDGIKRYADSVSSSTGILKNVFDLAGAGLSSYRSPLDSQLNLIAADSQRVVQALTARVLPTTQAENDALKLYQDSVGGSVTIAKDALGLSATLFDEYVSPSDAQLDLIASDAERIASRVTVIANTFSTDALNGAKLFADSTKSTFDAFSEGLKFFDAISSGDYGLNEGNFGAFEANMSTTLAAVNRLGAQAATIPPENIAAIQSVASALGSQADAWIKLADVPWSDLPQTLPSLPSMGSYGGGGGGGGNVTFGPNSIVVYAEAGMDVTQLANQVIDRADALMKSRR